MKPLGLFVKIDAPVVHLALLQERWVRDMSPARLSSHTNQGIETRFDLVTHPIRRSRTRAGKQHCNDLNDHFEREQVQQLY
jgi:hypothetical protein